MPPRPPRLLPKTLRYAASLVALAGVASAAPQAGLFVKDEPVPGLELPTIDGGETIDLAGLGGQRVILLQFASW